MSTAPEPRPHATSLLTGELDDAAFEALLERSLDDPELDAEIRLVADVVAAAERRSETPRAAEPGRRDRRLLLFATGVVGLAAAVLFIVLGPGALREESADSEQPTSVAQAPMATDSGAEVADAEAADVPALPPPPYRGSALRSSPDDLREAFATSMQAYVRGDYARAADDLETFLLERPEHGPARFYRAVCLEQLERLDEARSQLRRVADADADAGDLGEHALWRLIHLHLAPDSEERARSLLDELEARDGAFAPNARSLRARAFGEE